MPLTIEDGSRVDGANSYATVEEARAFALARGLTLPASDDTVGQLLVKACDYLQSLESRYKGSRVDDEQVLAWPRSDVYLFSTATLFDEETIPQQLIDAQCQLAVDANSVDLLPRGTGREILRQKVDVIETEYAKSGAGTVRPELNAALAILTPLFKGGLTLSTVRV